jgi:1-acyl-sn-glycerol-3-phosphate acyltransferase
MVAIGAPHTSNWDFIIAMATMFALGVRISWMGKHSIFVGPVGLFMRWLGGLSIDRRAPQGSVGQVVEAFHAADRLIVAITPEGTRRAVSEWRTGFYRIAAGAGVPILPIALDWQQRFVRFGSVIWPSGDVEEGVNRIKEQFRSVPGKHPHGF